MLQLKEWYETGHYITFGDYRIFYQEASPAKANTLLLLHGFPTSSWDWHLIWEDLSQRYHLIAPDFLGFGYSDKPAEHDYTIFEQADMVERLLEVLKVREYHLLAHNYGDTVAQELLAREGDSEAPLRLQSLILLNGGLFPETHRPRFIQKLLLSPIGKWLTPFLTQRTLQRNFNQIFGPYTQPSARSVEEWWSLIRYNTGQRVFHLLIRYITEREAHRARWVDPLLAPPVMVRLIVGEADPISGGHMADRYRKLVQNPDIQLIPGIGHYPQTEQPGLVLQYCQAFWDNL